MIYEMNKADSTAALFDGLRYAENRTDEGLREVQFYNIPHWVDLELKYLKTLWKTDEVGVTLWGAVYSIGNFYTRYNGLRDNKQWDRKYWMNEILQEDENTRNRHCTPFLVFRELNNGNFSPIDINTIAVEVGQNGSPYLYINNSFDDIEYTTQDGIISDVSKLKILLLPSLTDYICSDNDIDTSELTNQFNRKYTNPCINITISQDNKIFFDQDEWYEKIKIINPHLKFFKGTITETDRAIQIRSDLPYGSKVFKESLIMITPDGEIDVNSMDNIVELENNIYYFESDKFTGYSYFIFYYKEADLSINMIYNLPQDILDHDSESFITETNDYILLNKDYFKNFINGNTRLVAKDLRENAENYESFMQLWFTRALEYNKYVGSMGLVHPNYAYDENSKDMRIYFNDDVKYNYTLYHAKDIPCDQGNGTCKLKRLVWTMMDTDNDYNGYHDIILFINGVFYMPGEYYDVRKDDKFFIFKSKIIEDFGEDALVEIIYMKYNCDRTLDVYISYGYSPHMHRYNADRYYSPYTTNFFTMIVDKYRDKVDINPVFEMVDKSNPTLTQAIPFKAYAFHNVLENQTKYSPEFREKFSISFNENWTVLDTNAEITQAKWGNTFCDTFIGMDGRKDLFVSCNGKLFDYDLSVALDLIRDENMAPFYIDNYLVTEGLDSYKTSYADILPTDMENVTAIIGFNFNKYLVKQNGIAIAYGDKNNKYLAIATDHRPDYQIVDKDALGTIIKYTANQVNGGFAVMNNNNQLFEYTFDLTEDRLVLNRTIGIDIYDFNPIIYDDSDEIIIDGNGVISTQYDSKNKFLYVLVEGLGVLYLRKYLVNPNFDPTLDEEYIILADEWIWSQDEEHHYYTNFSFTICKDKIYTIGGLGLIPDNFANEGDENPDRIFWCADLNNPFFAPDGTKKLNFYKIHANETYGRYNRDYVIPEELGSKLCTLTTINDKVFLFGGYYDNRTAEYKAHIFHKESIGSEDGSWIDIDIYDNQIDTARRFGFYDPDIGKWEVHKANKRMYRPIVFKSFDGNIIALGGYDGPTDQVTNSEPYSVRAQKFMKNTYKCETLHDLPHGIGGPAAPIHDITNSNYVYIAGGNYPGRVIRFDCTAGRGVDVFDLPMDIEIGAVATIDYSKDYSSLLIIGGITEGHSHARLLKFIHEDPDSLFVDEYGEYNILHKGTIYTFKENIQAWQPMYELSGIYNETPIKKIIRSGYVFAAIMENNKIITSPDLINWYDYQHTSPYLHGNDPYYGNQFVDLATKYDPNNEEIDGITTAVAASGEIIINPYSLNMTQYYDNMLLAASTRRFVLEEFEVDKSVDYIRLPEKFKFCLDTEHYVIFEDGIRMNQECYKIVIPEIYSPINGINIYLNYARSDEYKAKLQVVYLPFVMEETKVDYEYLADHKLLNFTDKEQVAPYGVNMNWNWIFVNGKKIPSQIVKTVSNTTIQLQDDDNEIPKTIYHKELNDFITGSEMILLKTYDRANNIEFEMIEDMWDKYCIDTCRDIFDNLYQLQEANPELFLLPENYNTVLEKSIFEDIIVLLKIYQDHYVPNVNRHGDTPPYDHNYSYEGKFFYVNNGNIVWRDDNTLLTDEERSIINGISNKVTINDVVIDTASSPDAIFLVSLNKDKTNLVKDIVKIEGDNISWTD